MRSRFLSQFGNPTGALGSLAGWVMAYRGGNRRRNLWTVEQLDLCPSDDVLEIGYGPGIAVRGAARVARHVVGVDRSEVMRRQALRRNRKGNVTLIAGTIDDLPPEWAGRFTKAFGVNVFMFWPDPVAVLRKVSRFLAPGAVLALTQQPRGGNMTGARELSTAFREAGFTGIEERSLALKPPVTCVLGHAPMA